MIKYPYTVKYRDGQSATIYSPPTDLPDPKLSDNAVAILEDRYVKKNEEGEILETPKQVFWRVAEFVSYGSAAHGLSEEGRHELACSYYKMMADGLFLPNTPALVNAGKIDDAQLNACFVLPINDSLVRGEASIFGTLGNAALFHQTGGGTGFSFSRIRPVNSLVSRSSGSASGPVSFAKMYNFVTEVVKQGGVRRGANMGVLDVIHPDILEFIDVKAESDKEGKDGPLGNFNISIGALDEFMKAVKEGRDFNLVAPHTNQIVGSLNAKDVFDKIVYNAWLYGDPGMFFIDTVNRSVANPIKGWKIFAPNPCGEQPIYDNDACDLGSIKLPAFYRGGDDAWQSQFDWEMFAVIIHRAVRFLDDVINVSTYPLLKVTEMVDSVRRIGLGPMGLADLLQLMMVPYDSELALEISREIGEFFKKEAILASQELAKERGPFPLFSQSIYADDILRRNACVTTVAPTGTLSRLVGCEGGIEATIEFFYIHQLQNLPFLNKTIEQVLKDRDLWSDGLGEEIKKTGRVSHIVGLPDSVREVFKVASEISPEAHVKMQAIWQNHFSESGISKTINMAESATVEDVANAFWLAYESGCMGITVFREGCARAPMMKAPVALGRKNKIKRPFKVPGYTYKFLTPHDNAYFTLNIAEEIGLIEGFFVIGKAGSEILELTEGIARLFSLIGRMPEWPVKDRLRELIKQLRDIGGKKALGPDDEKLMRSVCDGVAFCCQEALDELNGNKERSNVERASGMFCPECQSSLVFTEGCRGGKCSRCSFSSC